MNESDERGNGPKPRRKRTVLWVGLTLLASVIVVLGLRLLDSDSVDDADLIPPPAPTVAREANIATELPEIRRLLEEAEGNESSITHGDIGAMETEELRAMVGRGKVFYREFLALLDRTHLVVETPLEFGGESKHPTTLRTAGRWIRYLHTLHLRDGETRESTDLAIRWSRATRLCFDYAPSLPGFLVALAITLEAQDLLAATAFHPNISERELQQLAAQADERIDLDDAFRLALRHDYRLVSKFIDNGGEKALGAPAVFVFKPNRTRGILAQGARACLAAIDAPDPQAVLDEFASSLPQGKWSVTLSGNMAGYLLARPLVSAWFDVLPKLPRAQKRLHLRRVAIGLRRFEVARGQLPRSLEELVPDYLDRDALQVEAPVLYDRESRWIGYERPEEFEGSPAPEIEMGAPR